MSYLALSPSFNAHAHRYGKQYQYFQQIIAVYESEPDNFARLSELMQEMQETGQPPSEIVKDLAPGLQFDDEGMPVMPNMVRAGDCVVDGCSRGR